MWDWGGGITNSFYAPDGGTLSIVATVAAAGEYGGQPSMVVVLEGSFGAMTIVGAPVPTGGGGTRYAAGTQVGTWSLGAGTHYVGFYVSSNGDIWDSSKLLWFFTMR